MMTAQKQGGHLYLRLRGEHSVAFLPSLKFLAFASIFLTTFRSPFMQKERMV